MADSTYERVMQQLDQTELSLREVADGADVAYSTLTRIARRDTTDASVHVFDRLERFFRQQQKKRRIAS